VLILTFTLGACGGGGHRTSTPRQAPVIVIVAEDISGSAFDRNAARTPVVLEDALRTASDSGGEVFVIAITGDTAGARLIPVSGSDADFSAIPKWARTEVLRQQWKAQLRRAIMGRYQDWRHKAKKADGSDYIGLFLLLDDLLAGAHAGGAAQVWIVGDGFQDTPEWSLEPTSRDLDLARCRAKVQQLRAAGDFGQLHGAKVFFDGGGMRGDKGTARQQAILRGCWEEIIRGAGGITPPGWWEGTQVQVG